MDAGTSTEAVDFSWIQEMSDGDKDFEAEIFSIFLEDSQVRLETLTGAIPEQDAVAVHHEAHTLKGASGNVGAEPLRAMAYELEKLDLQQQQKQALDCLQRMQTEFDRVREAITAYLDR